ncbi:hypothetical protein P5V15_011060 [Pogonomyrmex californicus]
MEQTFEERSFFIYLKSSDHLIRVSPTLLPHPVGFLLGFLYVDLVAAAAAAAAAATAIAVASAIAAENPLPPAVQVLTIS